jgi:hypothetical protein
MGMDTKSFNTLPTTIKVLVVDDEPYMRKFFAPCS